MPVSSRPATSGENGGDIEEVKSQIQEWEGGDIIDFFEALCKIGHEGLQEQRALATGQVNKIDGIVGKYVAAPSNGSSESANSEDEAPDSDEGNDGFQGRLTTKRGCLYLMKRSDHPMTKVELSEKLHDELGYEGAATATSLATTAITPLLQAKLIRAVDIPGVRQKGYVLTDKGRAEA